MNIDSGAWADSGAWGDSGVWVDSGVGSADLRHDVVAVDVVRLAVRALRQVGVVWGRRRRQADLLAVAAKPVAEVGLHVGHAVVVERLFLVGVEVRLSVLAKGLGWVG